jgi:hypothetical protein
VYNEGVALVRVCDLHDLDEWWVVVEATREFELDGHRYEIDLCSDHVAAFDEALQPYVDGARRLGRRAQPGRRSSR